MSALTDRSLWNRILKGIMGPGNMSNADACADQTDERRITITQPADAAASTNVGPVMLMKVDKKIRVLEIFLDCNENITAHASNFTTFIVDYNNGNGGSATNVATGSTVTAGSPGNMTTAIPESLTIVTANQDVAAGNFLRFTSTKSNSGVQLPLMRVDIRYREI